MRAIDTHVHLDFYSKDQAALIAALTAADIGVLTIATSLESNAEVDQLSIKHPLVWGALGLHPTEIGPQTLTAVPGLLEEWQRLRVKNPKIVALGEVGLDYFRPESAINAATQKAVLRQFLTFALEKKWPVIFHCREAYGDLVTMLADYPGLRGVIHCFSGSQSQAEQFLALGLHLSFTAMITYPKNAELLNIVRQTPSNRLLLETDSPFLPPQHLRGQQNDPRQVLTVAAAVAESRNEPVENILEQTTATATKLFGLHDS